MGLCTCRGREKMSEDEYSLTQLFQKSMWEKMGFMHLHISSLGQNIIALFSIIWVKICEKIWVYALARCRGREKSEGEDGGLRYTVTRLFTTFQCFSSICIIVILNNTEESTPFSRIKIIWFVFGYTHYSETFWVSSNLSIFFKNLPWFSFDVCHVF